MRIKISGNLKPFFTHHKPENFWSTDESIENSIMYKIDLAYLSKRIGLPYGWHYRDMGRHSHLIRKDYMELYTIMRDVEQAPWRIYEVNDPTIIYQQLASRGDVYEALWEQYPNPIVPMERNPKIVPLEWELWYMSYEDLYLFYQNRGELVLFTYKQLQALSARNGVPTYLSPKCGGEYTRRRLTVYRRDLAHLLQVRAIKPTTVLTETELDELREHHGIYEMFPWMNDKRGV